MTEPNVVIPFCNKKIPIQFYIFRCDSISSNMVSVSQSVTNYKIIADNQDNEDNEDKEDQ